MNVIEVNSLHKEYTVGKRKNTVLNGVSFTISKGETVAVMGPSGSGKSTLLYTVSGMDSITSGEVKFCGKDISRLTNKELSELRLCDMGFVFQQMYMLKNLTVLDNIILPALENKKRGESRGEILRHAEALMEMLGISDIKNSYTSEVSGGQLQRACICRSMINSPRMIFADEPTGALNRQSSDDVMDAFTALGKNGATIMIVTHDAKVAAKCTRVMYIVDGSIKGEYTLGNSDDLSDVRAREKALGDWLMKMGW